MRLSIRHETLYRYSMPLAYAIQQLRLTPRLDAHQTVLDWDIVCNGQRNPFTDAYGNQSHMLTITGKSDRVRIEVLGTVDIAPLFLGRLQDPDGLSPLIFNVPTALTQTTETVAAFARKHLNPAPNSDDLLALSRAIREGVAYESGVTNVRSSASEALAFGAGVCQDHAHLFIACCHAHRIPARYVSGYIDPGTAQHGASHAWVDVWITQPDFQGWVSVDVTHGFYASASHCRLAIGRDYESAAPIKGTRRGGGEESLVVMVQVAPIKCENTPDGVTNAASPPAAGQRQQQKQGPDGGGQA